MEEMAMELGCSGLTATDLHERLKAGVGTWNQEEAKLSRFFDWSGKFKHYVKYWKFQSLVFTQWQTLHAEVDPATAEDAPMGEGDENQGQNKGETLQGKRGQDLVKALKSMQQSRHTLDIVADVLKDSCVKKYSNMIFFCQAPFATEYRRVLQRLHDYENDPEAPRHLQVGWANRFWALELWNILGTLANRDVMEALALFTPLAGKEDEQLDDAKRFGELIVRAASQRAWTMAIYELAPESWSGILDSSEDRARAALEKMKEDADIIDEAYQQWLTGTHEEQVGFQVVFSNLWLHKLTLVQD